MTTPDTDAVSEAWGTAAIPAERRHQPNERIAIRVSGALDGVAVEEE